MMNALELLCKGVNVMKLVMTMLVKNEADIIDQNIDFHASQGVDHFIVMDHGSEDDTLAILARYRDRGILTLYQQDDPGYYQAEWVTAMAREAAVAHQADWVINNDADEFWWPSQGDLRQTLASLPDTVGGVHISRCNFPAIVASDDQDFLARMIYRDQQSVNVLGQPLPSKFCHRGYDTIVVSQGNHDANDDALQSKIFFEGIEIFHFPVRSFDQFASKIRHGGKAYQLSPRLDGRIGATWRSLYAIDQQGGLRPVYQQQCLALTDLSGRHDDRWILDTRLRDYMARPKA
jgi:hypothetical protein